MSHTDETTDLQRAVLRVHRAMMRMPYGASTGLPYRPLDNYRELTAEQALQNTAEWMEGLAAVLRSHTDRHDATDRELLELKQQRTAIREFLGLNDTTLIVDTLKG
jgi:hypothetical protein